MAVTADQIRHTLSKIFRVQKDFAISELMESAKAAIRHSGFDFGKDIYSFDLFIAPETFASIEDQIDLIAKKIKSKVWKLGLDSEDPAISDVRIVPELIDAPGVASLPTPTQGDTDRIWQPRRIRLFLSHVSSIKPQAAALKDSLSLSGIDAFVAHADIEPTLLWEKEIEFALLSADALCALITDDFVDSQWCDQEVGFALGRRIPVIPVNCGANPYGFLGKHQAIGATLSRLPRIAPALVEIIAKQEHLKPRFAEATVEAVVSARSFQSARSGMNRIKALAAHLSDKDIFRLLEGARDNDKVGGASGVTAQIEALAYDRKIALFANAASMSEDFDDDIPF